MENNKLIGMWSCILSADHTKINNTIHSKSAMEFIYRFPSYIPNKLIRMTVSSDNMQRQTRETKKKQ